MLFDIHSEPELPDFELVANMLVAEGVQTVSSAQLQGMFCGHLAAGQRLSAVDILSRATELLEIESLNDDESKLLVFSLYAQSLRMLEATELIFTLSLPDEEEPLSIRTQALAEYCQGFLESFARYNQQIAKKISVDGQEALADLEQIAEIASEDSGESAESDFFQVSEYVRMIVLMLFSECNKTETEVSDAAIH